MKTTGQDRTEDRIVQKCDRVKGGRGREEGTDRREVSR